jgi:hypothetical protein
MRYLIYIVISLSLISCKSHQKRKNSSSSTTLTEYQNSSVSRLLDEGSTVFDELVREVIVVSADCTKTIDRTISRRVVENRKVDKKVEASVNNQELVIVDTASVTVDTEIYNVGETVRKGLFGSLFGDFFRNLVLAILTIILIIIIISNVSGNKKDNGTKDSV